MRRWSFLPWRSSRNASGVGPRVWQLSWPKRDELRPLLDRSLRFLQRREVLDAIYLGALAIVLAFAAYLFLTG
jgi:hypothetical protein